MQCRLCFSQLDKNGRPLFDDMEKHAFLEIIINFLQLGPKLCDDISTMICHECWQYLDDFYKFCKNIEKQQNTLQQELATVKIEPELEKAAVDIELSATSGTDPIDTNEETFVDIKDILINGVESILNEAQDEEFACANMEEETLEHREDSCEDDIKKTLKSKKCILSKQKKPKDTTNVVKLTVQKRDFKCTNCSKCFDNQKSLNLHFRLKHKYESSEEKAEEMRQCEEYLTAAMLLKCELCDVTMDTFAVLKNHYRVQHNTRGYIKCCKRKFYLRVFLVDHVNYHLNPKGFQCEICNKCCTSNDHLGRHMKNSHAKTAEPPKFECPTCGRGFTMNSQYQVHLQIHQTDIKYPCKICNKEYNTEKSLVAHTTFMHTQTSFICSYCGKIYRSKRYFKEHMAKHEGNYVEISIQCTICNSWMKKSSLPIHMESHEPVDITCELCKRIFHTKRAYLRHTRVIHTDPKKFACTLCDKKFRENRFLQEHIAVHTGDKKNKCRYCSQVYGAKASMYSHMKKKHNAEWLETKLQKEQAVNAAKTATTTIAIAEKL